MCLRASGRTLSLSLRAALVQQGALDGARHGDDELHLPGGGLGAGQAASVDGPLTDDTITYAYDELGRVTSRAINGVASSQAYDALGRVTSDTNVLGAFTYGYVGVTGRVQLVTYPNGQTSSYAYFDNLGDQRLQTIHHRKPDSSTLSKFDYTYDTAGNILTWQQQADSDAPTVWRYGYDRGDQLTAAMHQTTGETPTLLKRFGYAYDPAGNRTAEQIDDAVTLATHDSLNRLLTNTPGGLLTFQGTLDEPGRVTINGVPATVDATNQFQAAVPVTAGTNTITIAAVDASGNASEAVYEVDQAGTSRSSTYDANGNLASKTQDGSTWTYEFDAGNRLTRVLLNAAEIARFSYDGLGRRAEKVAGGVTHRCVYDGPHVVEERLSGGATGTIRYAAGPGIDHWLGRQNADNSTTYFMADHLGSIVRETDASGQVTLRRSYDAWGNLDAASAAVGGPAYTGRWWEPEIRLYDYRARFYDSVSGRFVSEDPVGLAAGANFYEYVNNEPINLGDPSGNNPASAALPWLWGLGEATMPTWLEPGLLIGGAGVAGWGVGRGIGHVPIGGGRTVDDAVHAGFLSLILLSERTLPRPAKPKCGCMCTCRADADDTMPGNVRPGLPRFAFGTAIAANCAEASIQAKRIATQNLGMKPKHIPCRCAGN